MVASKSTKIMKDGQGAPFTGAVAIEEVIPDTAAFTYLGDPDTEGILRPMPKTGGTVAIDQTAPGTTNAVVVAGSTLPTGAASAAKQPAFGTPGTPSTDVITVQGFYYGTPQPVRSTLRRVSVIPTVTGGSYTAMFVIGGVVEFQNILTADFTGTLESINLKFISSVQTTQFDVGIFNAGLLSAPYTDNTLPVWDGSDAQKLMGIYPLISKSSSFGAMTQYGLGGIGDVIAGGATTSLYAVVITKSILANPLATTADMILEIGVKQ